MGMFNTDQAEPKPEFVIRMLDDLQNLGEKYTKIKEDEASRVSEKRNRRKKVGFRGEK